MLRYYNSYYNIDNTDAAYDEDVFLWSLFNEVKPQHPDNMENVQIDYKRIAFDNEKRAYDGLYYLFSIELDCNCQGKLETTYDQHNIIEKLLSIVCDNREALTYYKNIVKKDGIIN